MTNYHDPTVIAAEDCTSLDFFCSACHVEILLLTIVALVKFLHVLDGLYMYAPVFTPYSEYNAYF